MRTAGSRHRPVAVALAATTTFVAVALVAACGGKPGSTTSSLNPVSLKLESLASKLVAANGKLLYRRDGKALRILTEDGAAYGIKDGAMVKADAESVAFDSYVTDKGAGFAIAPGNGWFLGDKTVARLGSVGGQPKLFTAESKGRHRVVFADDSRFVAFYQGKIEIYGLKQLKFVRTEISWPLANNEPVAGGYGVGTGKYWFATKGDFIYLDEAEGTLTTFPIKATGLEGTVRSWAFDVKKEDFEKGRLPKAGAALTDKGLFVSTEMKAAAAVNGAGGGGGGGGTTTPGAISFETDIKPIAQAHCAGCHTGGVFAGLKDALKEADWVEGKTKILERLKKTKGEAGYMPLPHGAEAQYTAERKAKLLSWLENYGMVPAAQPVATQPPVAATQPPAVATQPPAVN